MSVIQTKGYRNQKMNDNTTERNRSISTESEVGRKGRNKEKRQTEIKCDFSCSPQHFTISLARRIAN
jgi:hypothetical protein